MWGQDPVRVSGSWPHPAPSHVAEFDSILNDSVGPTIVDGLVGCAAPEIIAAATGQGHKIWLLVHLPLEIDSADEATSARLALLEKQALGAATGVITTSQWAKDDLIRRHGQRPIYVVEPGVTTPAPSDVSPRADAHPHFVTVASFTPRKNYDLIIDALVSIADLDWSATWAGAAPEPEAIPRLQARLAECGLEKRVTILGPVPPSDVERLWARSDLLLFPSRFETYGMVITEALAHGVPSMVGAHTASARTLAGPLDPLTGMMNNVHEAKPWATAIRQWLTVPAVQEDWQGWVSERRKHLRNWDECAQSLSDIVVSLS